MEDHMTRKYTHCPDCGAKLPAKDWPLTCEECARTHYLNPTPVAVLLQPIDGGLLAVRRDIAPHRGQLALPGGFVDLAESWQEAAVRELKEETGLQADAAEVRVFDVMSAPDGTLLIFGVAPPMAGGSIADFEPTFEVSELALVEEPRELAFELHTAVVARWFAEE
jgi:ADP-ribose pyrophosphatase YjhB (NUDIX family)